MTTSLTTRETAGTGATVKGSPLSNAEIDANFLSLNDNKAEITLSVPQDSGTGAAQLPVGTEAERPTAAIGKVRFNTTQAAFEGYDGVDWSSLGGMDITISDTAPTNPRANAIWLNTADGVKYSYYVDTDSSQWVELGTEVVIAAQAPVAINDLTDVDTATAAPTDGQTLTWNDTNSKWEPADVASSGGVTTGKAIAMAIVFGG
jgi:hypothetical protein